MSYIARCLCCDVPISMEDDFDEDDIRICELCRTDIYRGLNPNVEDSK